MDAGFDRFLQVQEDEMCWRKVATQAQEELAECLHSGDMREISRRVEAAKNRAAHLLHVQATGWQQIPLFQE